MTRLIHGSSQPILDSKTSSLALLLQLDFGIDGMHYFTSVGQSIGYNGNTYIGLGGMLNIGQAEESVEIQSYGLTFTISGISDPDLTIAAKALSLNYRNKSAFLSIATLNADYEVAGDPILIFAGRMDYMTISLGTNTVISVNTSSRLTDWETPRGGRYTQGYQQSRVDADDFGFDYVQQLIHQQLAWGVPDVTATILNNTSGTEGAGVQTPVAPPVLTPDQRAAEQEQRLQDEFDFWDAHNEDGAL
jgi:hypothetical protein